MTDRLGQSGGRCKAPAEGGPCALPEGHNMGKADIPENHRAWQSRRYRLVQPLNRAVRELRKAEDIARIEMSYMPTADRIRSIYEQITADVLNGKTSVPPIAQRLCENEERCLRLANALTDIGVAEERVQELWGG